MLPLHDLFLQYNRYDPENRTSYVTVIFSPYLHRTKWKVSKIKLWWPVGHFTIAFV